MRCCECHSGGPRLRPGAAAVRRGAGVCGAVARAGRGRVPGPGVQGPPEDRRGGGGEGECGVPPCALAPACRMRSPVSVGRPMLCRLCCSTAPFAVRRSSGPTSSKQSRSTCSLSGARWRRRLLPQTPPASLCCRVSQGLACLHGLACLSTQRVPLDRKLGVFLRRYPEIKTDVVALIDEWATRFFEELDYVNEGNNATLFAASICDDLPQARPHRQAGSEAAAEPARGAPPAQTQGVWAAAHARARWAACHTMAAHARARRAGCAPGG